MRSLPLVFSFLLLVSACIPMTSVRHSQDYHTHLSDSLAVLPVEASISMVDIGNKAERMYDYESHLEMMLSQAIIAEFQQKGYRATLFRKQDIYDKGISSSVLDLRQHFKNIGSELIHPLMIPEAKAFSTTINFGDKASTLGKEMNSKAIVIAEYSGAIKTNGARARDLALDLLLGSQMTTNVDGSRLLISIIDTSTGQLLWSNVYMDSKSLYGSAIDNFASPDSVDSKRIKAMVNAILSPLPAGKSL